MREHQDAVLGKTAKFQLEKQCLEPRPERGVGHGTFSMPLGGGSRGVHGATPLLFRGHPMGRIRHRYIADQSTRADMPLAPREWKIVAQLLRLSPQQARIVGQILLGKEDKQIAEALELSKNTIRTHLSRLFMRLKVGGRVGLLLKILQVLPRSDRRPNGISRHH